MSRIADALLTQRKWQKCELAQQLLELDQAIQSSKQNIINSCTIPAFIQPELEMARMHYWMNQEQARVALMADRAVLETQEIKLNTALKMLEKHQDRQMKKKRIAMMLTQQVNSDEWIVQRRESE